MTYGKPPKLATNRAKIAKICSVSFLYVSGLLHMPRGQREIN